MARLNKREVERILENMEQKGLIERTGKIQGGQPEWTLTRFGGRVLNREVFDRFIRDGTLESP